MVVLYSSTGGIKAVTFTDVKSMYIIIFYTLIFTVFVGLFFIRIREQRIENREKELKALAGIIAHELRTPLASLQLLLAPMKRLWENALENVSDRKLQELKIQDRNHAYTLPIKFEKLTQTANSSIDILLMDLRNQLDHEKLQRHMMGATLKRALAIFPIEKEAPLILNIEKDFAYMGNSQLMAHAICNLLINAFYAIKAKGHGEITISFSTGDVENILTIEDTGTGMSPYTLRNLFEKFYTTKPSGTGLGLPFCKNIIEAFQGRITAESLEGEGSIFRIYLPANVPEDGLVETSKQDEI